ncbi:MAG TPA: hypothetical protein VE359_08350 [Vicinamibacteria bacterium]|jgi:hypothetical protein|nr:hypothetical protein [Vicinamibacteria bacterium]
MRVVQAAALTAAALLLTSVASAQGLGDAAAAAREKRKADPAKPAKVYTEGDIGQTMAPVSTTRDLPAMNTPATSGGPPATEGQATAGGQPVAEGQPPGEGGNPTEGAAPAANAAEDAEKAEAEAQAKAAEAWRRQLDQARKEEAVYKDIIDKVQVQMNGNANYYSPGRAANAAFLEENKQKLAETQAKIAALEDEGRRNRY